MADASNLNDATINYLVCTAGISFGLAGLTGAYDIFRQVVLRTIERRIFNSIVAISGIVTVASLLPLALSETEFFLIGPSYWLLISGLAAYATLLGQIVTGRVKVFHPTITYTLLPLTAVIIALIPVNAHLWHSIVAYKLFVLWGTFILAYRFFLFISHISRLSHAASKEP